jgi:hypothetical protein
MFEPGRITGRMVPLLGDSGFFGIGDISGPGLLIFI